MQTHATYFGRRLLRWSPLIAVLLLTGLLLGAAVPCIFLPLVVPAPWILIRRFARAVGSAVRAAPTNAPVTRRGSDVR